MKEIDNCAMLRAAVNNMQMGHLDHLANGGKNDPAQERWIDALSEGVEALERLEKQKWISVEERLPELNVEVLGWYKDNPFSAYRRGVVSWNGKGWVFVYARRYVTNVTHWMVLPEPPKEDRP